LQAEPAEVGELGNILADLGSVTLFFSQEELDVLLEKNSDRLVVVEASLTWCPPCKGFEKTLQVPCHPPGESLFCHILQSPMFLYFFDCLEKQLPNVDGLLMPAEIC